MERSSYHNPMLANSSEQDPTAAKPDPDPTNYSSKLPGEVRNMIYDFRIKRQLVNIGCTWQTPEADRLITAYPELGSEMRNLYFARNVFRIDARAEAYGVPAPQPGDVAKRFLMLWSGWVNGMTRRQVGFVQHLVFNTVPFKCSINLDPKLQMKSCSVRLLRNDPFPKRGLRGKEWRAEAIVERHIQSVLDRCCTFEAGLKMDRKDLHRILQAVLEMVSLFCMAADAEDLRTWTGNPSR